MERRLLGRTGLEVTRLGYGCGELRGKGAFGGREISEEQAEAILNAALDAGINYVDVSPDYGSAEHLVGKFLSHRRGEFHLATKCGCDPIPEGDHLQGRHTWTRDTLVRNIHESLERLRTDRVDVLQMHNPAPDDVRKNRLVEALQEIQGQGMTRFIGVSTTLPDLRQFVEMGVFDVFQVPYSALQPEHHDALRLVAQAGAGVVVRGGIAQGAPDNETARPERTELWQHAGLDEVLEEGMTAHELILRYTLSHPNCDTTIVATINPEHLREDLAAAGKGPLPPQLYEEVRTRVAGALAAR